MEGKEESPAIEAQPIEDESESTEVTEEDAKDKTEQTTLNQDAEKAERPVKELETIEDILRKYADIIDEFPNEASPAENTKEVEKTNDANEPSANSTPTQNTKEAKFEIEYPDEAETRGESFEEIAFAQSTEQARELQKNPEYFTYLVSPELGYAIKKTELVGAFAEKARQAESNEEIWQAIRLGTDILYGQNDLDERTREEVRDFMDGPAFQSKKLQYDISVTEKRLKSAEENVKRCKEAYNKVNSGNVISKFLRRDEIEEARYRLENAIASRDDQRSLLKTSRNQLAMLKKMKSPLKAL